MTTPRFSVLIPTRERPSTFRRTLATVLAQPGDDYEIVIADNCSGPETRRIVEEAASDRLHYTRSDEVLPMAINWERGLALCSGEYVTVLGDDDGFVPSTLPLARRIIGATDCEILGWFPHTYWWPDTIVHWSRNMLIVELGEGAMWIDSRRLLEDFYRGAVSFGLLPMIYNAFFHRGVIEEAVRRYDGFFVPPDTAPDVASGILGLYVTERFIYSGRPLSIRGNSGKSNGTAQWARSLGAEQREIFYREERVGLKGLIHEALVPSPNITIIIASAKLKCRDRYFPADPALTVDLAAVLREMIAQINFEPEAYEENLADIRALAAKLGIRLDPAEIPAKVMRPRLPGWGPQKGADGAIAKLVVNCELAGASDIAAASRIVDALLAPWEQYLVVQG
jgi:glycosyltransferase involved in cell wall biosynthesis